MFPTLGIPLDAKYDDDAGREFSGSDIRSSASAPPPIGEQRSDAARLHKRRGMPPVLLRSINDSTTSSVADLIPSQSTEVQLTSIPQIRSSTPVADEWVASHLPAHALRGVHDRFRQVEEMLASGAIILGENHSCSIARALVCDLISSQRVSALFVEIADIDAEVLGGPAGITIGESVRACLGSTLDANEAWQQLKATMRYRDLQYGSDIPLADVIAHSTESGVPVYFIDNEISRRPGSIEGMRKRNRTAGKAFLEHANVATPGAVILIGSGHLKDKVDHSGAHRYTIQHFARIHNDRIFDFSEP